MGFTKCICNRWCLYGIERLPESIVVLYGTNGTCGRLCGNGIKKTKFMTRILIGVFISFTALVCRAQSTTQPIPHLEKQGNATRLVVEGKPILLLAGELHNSSTGGLDYMLPI